MQPQPPLFVHSSLFSPTQPDQVRCADASCVWVGMLQFVPEAYRGATKAGRMRCIPTVKDEQPSDAVKMFASAELLKRSPWIDMPMLPGPNKAERLPFGAVPATWQQVWVTGDGGEAYVHWSFYNGAMATQHCDELREVLAELAAQPDIKTSLLPPPLRYPALEWKAPAPAQVVTLVGDRKVFSNGIHLNPLAAMLIDGDADCMAEEGWANINGIDDVIKEVFKMTNKAVVSAVWGNAGAGGAIVPLAGDIVWAHAGAVFNASYDNMGLFGSEYWTYLLPMRVGDQLAATLTTECQPINANQAKSIKFVDDVIACKHDDFPNESLDVWEVCGKGGRLWLAGWLAGRESGRGAGVRTGTRVGIPHVQARHCLWPLSMRTGPWNPKGMEVTIEGGGT
eukprot:11563-Chlamydomonas_euryale.AAC.11